MKAADVCAEPDNKLLSLEQALQQIKSDIHPVTGTQQLNLKASLGRILASDIAAPANIPAQRNSAMDGYALNSTDRVATNPKQFTVCGTSWAGKPFQGTLQSGQCVRIFTGAIMPDNADSVIMQEAVVRQGEIIQIQENITPGDYVRHPGDDIRAGQLVLHKGKQLTPADLGLLASLGIRSISVRRSLRVAFFSTGDELRPLGNTLSSGEIYDSNRYSLHGLLQSLGIEAVDMGVIGDQTELLITAFKEAADIADVVITSGGVSVGEADLVKPVLEQLGRVNFWKIAIKPGKPFAYGALGNSLFFGLPGNPVSVMVTFQQIVKPALLQLMGREALQPLRLKVRCQSELRKVAGRLEFQRGILAPDEQGELTVTGYQAQGSHILSSMSRANCFIILPANNTGIRVGETVEVEPFDTLI